MADSRVVLSGSTNGRGIKVAATSTPGTTIHTSGGTDEIHIWAYNSDTVDRALTIEFGGTTAPDDNIYVNIPSKSGAYYVVPGLTLTGSLVVKAFAAATNVVVVYGYVNRLA